VAHIGKELRLVLARVGELAALFLDLVEQANVLDGDHRLVGERGDQLDLPVRKRRDLRFPYSYYAERNALTQQGYRQHASEALQSQRFREVIFRV
jgi:hypothetical protein